MRKRVAAPPTNRVIPYLRQSLARPGETRADSLSLEAQEARIADWAERRGYTLASAVRDHDLTGDNPARPGLDELRRLAHPGDLIAVHMFDRLARDLLLQEQLVREFNGRGVDVVSISQPSDPLSRQMHGAFSEYFSRQLSERLVTVTRQRAARGNWLGSRTPFGYRRTPILGPDGTQLGLGPLEPDPIEAHLVIALYQRRAAGETMLALTDWLDEIIRPRTAPSWTDGSVMYILRNPLYAGGIRLHGDISWNGTHPTLIDRDLWEAVQARRVGAWRRRPERRHWAEGLVLHTCGWHMPLEAVTPRNGRRNIYLTYRCAGINRRCHKPRRLIGAPVLERAVRQALAADLAVLITVPDAIAQAEAALADPDRRAEADRLRRDRARLATRLERARQLWLAGEDDITVYQRERAAIQQQLAELDAALAAFPGVIDPAALLTAAEILAAIPALLPTLGDESLRTILTDLGTILVTPTGVRLTYHAPYHHLIPDPIEIPVPTRAKRFG